MPLLGLLLAACGNAGAVTPLDSNAVVTSIVGTLVEQHFLTETAVAPAATIPSAVPTTTPLLFKFPPTPIGTPTYPYFTFTPLSYPTLTPSVTGTIFTPTIDPGSLAYGCNNLAFVRDVTIPAGTYVRPGEQFGKTWKVANTGTCNWLFRYALVPLSSGLYGGQTTLINKIVVPGHWAEVSVSVTAPDGTGDYTAYWRMSDADGHLFGATLVVSFTVSTNPTDTPQVPTETETPIATPTSTP